MEVQAQHHAEVMFVTMQDALPKPKVRRKGNHLFLQYQACQRQLMLLAHVTRTVRHELLNELKSGPRASRRRASPRKAKTQAPARVAIRQGGGIATCGITSEVEFQ